MNTKVITRFAPSPSGYLHIGGARTALFNWLFAKANNGEMLLRIEDTDRARSSEDAVDAILDGLTWLGLDWAGEPISQFSRLDRHREVVDQMLENGTAYRCYSTQEDLEAMRETAKSEGRNPMYDGTWRGREPADWPEELPYAVRIKTPEDGETLIEDKVQGPVQFQNTEIDDFVLLRSDGTPTYMLAVVVDDHDMGVTHIIRGDDHLANAAKQVMIYNALGWTVPVMAHIPLIHGADGAKLSKRHGAMGAEAYRTMGYLPQALRNYLVRLGWSHGDDEIMSTGQMIEWFSIEGINKAAARFDYDKLDAINAHYMREMEPSELLDTLMKSLPFFNGGPEILASLNEMKKERLISAIPALSERSKTLVELVSNADFIYNDRPLPMEEKALSLVTGDGKAILEQVLPVIESLEDWKHDGIADALKDFCEQNDIKLGKVAQPIRAALTGKNASPGAFDVLLILGKSEALARIRDHL